MRGTKLYAMFAAMFMAGAFLASPELRAYAANTVGSADIINNSIQSVDIKNGQVKAIDIAQDAVGASEIQGVTKLMFSECAIESNVSTPSGQGFTVFCTLPGVDDFDNVVATNNGGNTCFSVTSAQGSSFDGGEVGVTLINDCSVARIMGSTIVSIIVYDN